MHATKNVTGNLYFVSGLANGREVFLGKAIDEPFQGQLTLEGKSIGLTPQGLMVVRPFRTIANFPIADATLLRENINLPEAIVEANKVLEMSVNQILPATLPLIYRWVYSNAIEAQTVPWAAGPSRNGFPNAFSSFYEGFVSSAEQFRRALFQAPQVTSTRELDKLTELEGDLIIETGKITNQIAIRFNQLVARESELNKYMEAIRGIAVPLPPAHQVGVWLYLMNRLQIAKNWARRIGKAPIVREINALNKDAITGINEVILEHCGALDTLITETFAQYGITFEIYGTLSPFASYTAPLSGSLDQREPAPAMYAGVPAAASLA